AFRPVAGPRIDMVAEHVALAAPAQALVDARDRRTRSVAQRQDVTIIIRGFHGTRVGTTVPNCPLEDSLQLERLPLPLFVVGCNADGRTCSHVLDTVQAVDDLSAGEWGAAGVAAVDGIPEMSSTARLADPR